MLIVAMIAGSVSSFAQTAKTPEQSRRKFVNDSVSQVFAKRYGAQREAALEMAKVKGWPVKIKENGVHAELMGISAEGTPLYYQTSNAGSARTSRSNTLYPGGSAGLNLTGAGVLGGIWDEDKARLNHTTFSNPSRIESMDSSGETGEHATHVAGTIVGNGGNNAEAKGIAYEGLLWVYDWTNDLSEMSANGESLVVSNHSYGLRYVPSNPFPVYYYGKYMQESRDLDEIMFNNPNYQVVVAAGNDRTSGANPTKNGNDLLTTKGTAKNVLTVAAVSEVANYAAITPSQVNIASFSNFGPTDDFRIKPDIATKGVNVFSSISSGVTTFGTLSGTSMASPGVSGVIMLLQQHYSNLHSGDYMRSATVRALIAGTADEIGEEEGPDHMTGWGLINAEKSVLTMSAAGTPFAIVDQRTLVSGDDYTLALASDGENPLIVTIAWTDPQGAVASNTVDSTVAPLVNDLDIRLTGPAGDVSFPWTLNRSFANPVAINTEDNKVDNIEKIQVNAPAGTYNLVVSHKRTLNGGSQEYSLVVTGINQDLASIGDVTNDLFTIWPNPATSQININLKSGSVENANVSIFDIQGRQVASQKLFVNQGVINVDHLSAGVYMVKVAQGAKQSTQKIILK